MGHRPLGVRSQVAVRAMLSLDPLTVGGSGYPLLFQSGETFEGRALVDRQHPHDLFSELALAYGRAVGERAGVFAYFGLPGEPALGPPAFMHRTSARHLPDSPLGHHLQDATHILFGVATLGARYGPFKLDGSLFTGSEPDEERFGLDRPRFDSYSLRFAVNPTDRLAFQVSRGYLKGPEALEPELDLWRTTASLLYDLPFGAGRHWATALVWGRNEPADGHAPGEEHAERPLNALLLESDLQRGRQAFYTRLEWVDRAGHDLALDGVQEFEKPFPGRVLCNLSEKSISRGRHYGLSEFFAYGAGPALAPLLQARDGPSVGRRKGDPKNIGCCYERGTREAERGGA